MNRTADIDLTCCGLFFMSSYTLVISISNSVVNYACPMYASALFSRHMLPDLMGGKRRLSSLVVCLSCFIVVFGDATHFRGGTVWWTPSTNYSDANRVVSMKVDFFSVIMKHT